MSSQSDFNRKKNFANPNVFKNSKNKQKQASAAQPAPAQQKQASAAQPASAPARPATVKASEPSKAKTPYVASSAVVAKQDQKALSTEDLKHPLENTWTLWYLENDRSKSWEDMQSEIKSVDTVEDFWSLYNHIKRPSEIKVGCDYSLFKKGIRPMWEDAANKQGGRWVITLNKSSRQDLDNLWLETMLCFIGEAFDHSEEICGAVVNIRPRANKISIWTANGNNEVAALEIGHKLKEALHLGSQTLQYQMHKDTMVKQVTNIKATYTL